MSFDKIHIRHIMLFEFRLHGNAAEATRKICSVYPEAISESQCRRWFQKFRNGNFDLEDEVRSGRPSDFDNDAQRFPAEIWRTNLGAHNRLLLNHREG
jgi:[histone H3]-lysine36 N-dimethyltransferase SETMAR